MEKLNQTEGAMDAFLLSCNRFAFQTDSLKERRLSEEEISMFFRIFRYYDMKYNACREDRAIGFLESVVRRKPFISVLGISSGVKDFLSDYPGVMDKGFVASTCKERLKAALNYKTDRMLNDLDVILSTDTELLSRPELRNYVLSISPMVRTQIERMYDANIEMTYRYLQETR